MAAALHLIAVYFGTAGLCLWLVHRLVRPMSWTAAAWLVLLPVALPGPALLQGKIYAPMDLLYEHPPWTDIADAHEIEVRPSIAGDLPFQIVPWHKAVRDAWAAGDWPLWNPYMLAGDLLAASAQPAPFHPLNLLSLLLPLDLSLTYQAAAMLFLAALGAWIYARELGCGDPAALIGAASFMLCGFLVFWLLWPMCAAVATLPWIVAGIHRLPRFGLLTAGLSLLLLSGHPESMLHAVATACLYGFFVVAGRFRTGDGTVRRRLTTSVRIVGAALVAGLAAGGVAAIHLLPIVDALPETAMYQLRRSHFADLDHSVPWLIARERVLTVVLPFRFGLTWTPESLPAPGFFVPMSSAYVGTVALSLALFGLWRGSGRLRWFFAFWAAVGVAAGAGAPGVTHAMAALPLFELSIHRRWVFAAAWALSSLAALGAEAWSRRPAEDRTVRRDVAICFFAVAVVAGLALWENWHEMRFPSEGEGLAAGFLRHHGLLLLLPPVVAGAAVLLLRRIAARRLLWLLLALAVVQRAGESNGRFPTIDRDDFAPSVPILSAIADHPEPSRVVALGFTFLANASAYYGLEDVRGYQPMASRIYFETFPLWDTEPKVFFNEVTGLDRPFLDFLGVRWAIAPLSVEPAAGWRQVQVSRSVQLLENDDALPRAFLPATLVFGTENVRRQMAQVADFAQVAFIDTAAADPRAAATQTNADGSVVTRRHGTSLHIQAELDGEGWVVVSQPHWRGWKAIRRSIDGERVEVPVHTANHAFLALPLPAGRHEVELYFSPTSFRIGRAVTLTTLLLLLVPASLRRRGNRKEA